MVGLFGHRLLRWDGHRNMRGIVKTLTVSAGYQCMRHVLANVLMNRLGWRQWCRIMVFLVWTTKNFWLLRINFCLRLREVYRLRQLRQLEVFLLLFLQLLDNGNLFTLPWGTQIEVHKVSVHSRLLSWLISKPFSVWGTFEVQGCQLRMLWLHLDAVGWRGRASQTSRLRHQSSRILISRRPYFILKILGRVLGIAEMQGIGQAGARKVGLGLRRRLMLCGREFFLFTEISEIGIRLDWGRQNEFWRELNKWLEEGSSKLKSTLGIDDAFTTK